MRWEIFAAFAATLFVFAITPGPAVLLTVGHGMKSGWGASLKSALGVQAGNGVYFLLSVFGLGALLLSSEDLFHAIKYLGAAYLAFLGFKAIKNAGRAAEPKAAEPQRGLSDRPFWQATLMQLANPKSVLFFGALMPQFIDPNAPLLPQYALFAAVCFFVEMPILAVYGWLAAQGRRFTARPRVAVWRERLSGACLVGVGASLALIRRAA
jgi:homoserine/homoserine lactone efflux protein